MSDAKETIRTRLDLAEVIGETVALKPAGRDRLKGLCPFHSERTPSFHVHVGRGFYYCFGCGAKGDLFDFVMRTQGVDFVEALTTLGRRAGVEVEPATPKGGRRRDLIRINEMAFEWFRANLADASGAEALAYLRRRRLTEESVEAWGLGFAPAGWDGLLRHALTKGFRDDDLLAAGLLSENERGRRYDRFRNRVIFPIRDRLGRPVGFAGRVLDDSLPKYLNTPETDAFDKGSILYGLDRARAAIRERGECLVVEGYMDVIALHQTGFPHAVAALGATLTEEQAQELSRLDVQRLLLAFDADDAGRRAVLAGLERSVGRRFLVAAVTVPHGKDPADAVLEGHAEEFRAALEGGLSEVEFRFRAAMDAHDASTVQGRRAILEDLAPAMTARSLDDPVAQEMRRRVTHALGLDETQLNAWLGSRRSHALDEVQVRGMSRDRDGDATGVREVEVEVMAILLNEPARLRARLPGIVAALPPELSSSRLREFASVCDEEAFDPDRVLARYRDREEGAALFARLFEHGDDGEARPHTERHLETTLSRLRELVLNEGKETLRKALEARKEEVLALLKRPDLDGDTLQDVYRELAEIQTRLAARDAERRLRMPAARGRGRRR